MPAPITSRTKKSDAIWSALRTHIIKERQKKKQEQEADAEVERQRKERERQQKQDVMTLGETREQIQQLETRLAQLKEEKHQLFLQLKKVLNEDDNRRRQKESNDMMLHSYQPGAVTLGGHSQIFLQPNLSLSRSTLYKLPPGHNQHSLLPPGTLKRSRSPSPPPQNYHPGYNYKPTTHYTQQKVDDGRRTHEYARAVLWNKNPPSSGYGSTQSSAYYSHPPVSQVAASTTVSYAPAQTVYSYSNAGHPQYTQPPPGAPTPARDETPGKHASPGLILSHGQTQPSQQRNLPQHGQVTYVGMHPQLEHINQKPQFASQDAEKFYPVAQGHPAGVAIRPATHVPIHGGSIPIQQAPQGTKSGGITSGYPIRGQPTPHVTTGNYQPAVSTPHSSNVSQAPVARLSYTQSQHTTGQGSTQPGHGPSPGRYTVPGFPRES